MMQNKTIAVTGGIGSGKTEFCKILQSLGYAVFSCDKISDGLWEDADYLAGLAEIFPQCSKNGRPQKKLISDLVFSDKEALEKLNSYAHPRIMKILLDRMRAYHVAIAEVPLLFEGGYENLFDAVVIVTREEKARLIGAALRDGLCEAEIAAKMRAQKDLSSLEKGKYIVAENDGTLDELRNKAKQILQRLGI